MALRDLDLEHGRTGWGVAAIGVLLLILPSADWRIPDARGIPYPIAFALGALVAVVGLGMAALARGRRLGPFHVLVTCIGVASVLGALTILPTQPLRDLGVYLRAGEQFAAGAPVYLDHLIDAVPVDRTQYPFLYPPLLLPPLAWLAGLPRPLVEGAWVAGSVAAVVFALRRFGLSWRWALAALAWRPVLEGLYVGNVAVPLLACLAVAVRHPAALVIPPVFKAYSGTATLWLVRERHWKSLVTGATAVGLAVLLTAGATGLDAWREWLAGLDWFVRSQPVLRDYLYGIALPRYVGAIPALAIGLAVLALSLRARGTESLARLGLSTPALSPSVFVHGFLVAIPAMLALRPAVLWLAVAAMSFGSNAAYWVGPGLAVAAWLVPGLRRGARRQRRMTGIPDPLGGAAGPWPSERQPERTPTAP